MEKVYLRLNENVLGYLRESENGYIFHADKEGIDNATKISPIKMKFFTLNRSGIKEYSQIPNHFIQYLDNWDREDIMEKAGIVESDSDFVKLYKIAGTNLQPINFAIMQG